MVPSCAGELLRPGVNFRARSTRQEKVTIDQSIVAMEITDQVAMVDNTHAVASLAVMAAMMVDRHTVVAMTGTISMIATVD